MMAGNKLTNQVKDAQGNCYGFFNPIYTDVLSYAQPQFTLLKITGIILRVISCWPCRHGSYVFLPGLKIKTNGGVNANFQSDIYDAPTDLRENDQYGASAKINYGNYSQNIQQTVDWLLERHAVIRQDFLENTP